MPSLTRFPEKPPKLPRRQKTVNTADPMLPLPQFPGKPPKLPRRRRSADAGLEEAQQDTLETQNKSMEEKRRRCAPPVLPEHRPSILLESIDLGPVKEICNIADVEETEDDIFDTRESMEEDKKYRQCNPPVFPKHRPSITLESIDLGGSIEDDITIVSDLTSEMEFHEAPPRIPQRRESLQIDSKNDIQLALAA